MLNSEQKYFELKECSKCGTVYPATDEYFGRTKKSCDGLKKTCKVCISKYNKEYQIKNREKLVSNMKEYRENNKEQFKEMKRKYNEKNREKVAERSKKYKEKNKENLREKQKLYYRERLKNDHVLREKIRLQNLLRRFLINGSTSQQAEVLIGCTSECLRKRFESLFKDGMSWDNYGVYGWQIDHIIPISKFDIMDDKQKLICYNYKNLQPLWFYENIKKKDSCDYDIERMLKAILD